MSPLRCSAERRITLMPPCRAGGNVGIALQELGVAQDGVERRAQLVGEADHVAALGEIGGLGHVLGALQRRVRPPVRLDFLEQESGLPPGFLLGDAAALARQNEKPSQDARYDEQDREGGPERVVDHGLDRRSRRWRLRNR